MEDRSIDSLSTVEPARAGSAGDEKCALASAEPIVFSTDGAEPKERFESWRVAFGSVHDVEIDTDRRRAFSARGAHWRLGSILFGVYETPARRVVRSSKRCARDDLDHWILRVPRVGSVVVRSGDDLLTAGPGELVLRTYASPYEENHTAGEWVAVMIPRDALPLLRCCPPPRGVLKGVSARLLADFLLSLAQRLQEASGADLPAIGEATRAMLSACVHPTEASPRTKEVFLRERVNRIVLDNVASARLDPARLSDLTGISRASLYRMFESRGGVARHLLRLRLGLVRRDLANPLFASRPVAKLAEDRGLHNITSFNRAFRREFGCTPGDARAAALLGAPLPLPNGGWQGSGGCPRFIDLLA